MDTIITCPNCDHEIKLNESLAGPLLEKTRAEYEEKLKERHRQANQQADQLRALQEKLLRTQEENEHKLEERLLQLRTTIVKEETDKAKQRAAFELKAKNEELLDLQDALKERESRLEEARKLERQMLKDKRALEEREKELEILIEKRVQESQALIQQRAEQNLSEQYALRFAEKEKQLQQMASRIEDLKQKAEQGSQQLQGEVLEVQIEEQLNKSFPMDQISEVPKGIKGADIIQTVFSNQGSRCGTLIWEAKRAKNWSSAWIPKLKDDQREIGADQAILVSTVLPNDVETMDFVEGVWVTSPRYAIPLALALRQTLVEVNNVKQIQEGQETKQELVYAYLTGPKFKHRIQAIAEKFNDMQEDLLKEKRAMERLWAKRQQQIEAVISTTTGMWGDLQGIAGQAFDEIEGMDFPLLD